MQIGKLSAGKLLSVVAAITASILLGASHAPHKAKHDHPAAAELSAPGILVLDRNQIWARYVDPAFSEQDSAARKTDLAKSMQPILQQISQRNGGAIILYKDALMSNADGGDVTPEVMAGLDGSFIAIENPAPTDPKPAKPISPLFLVSNRDMLVKLLKMERYFDPDSHYYGAINATLAASNAILMIDKKTTPVFAEALDATTDVQQMLIDIRNAPKRHPLAHLPARILILDYEGVYKQSKAGKSINAQLDQLTKSAVSQLGARAHSLSEARAELQEKGPPPQSTGPVQAATDAQGKALWGDVNAWKENIRKAVVDANSKVAKTLNPILISQTAARHATLLITSDMVAYAPDGLDITAQSLQALDAALPSVTVDMPPSPP